MKTILTGLVLGAVAMGCLRAQDSEEKVAPVGPGEDAGLAPADDPAVEGAAVAVVVDPRDLVKRLADDVYREREAAQAELWELGEVGLEALEEGAASDDPERAYRSRILLRRIQTGIGPGSSQDIVDLVERYYRGSAKAKRAVLDRLVERRAYSQVLRLYRFEKDPDVREACEEVVSTVVFPAVNMELARGDLAAAESLLRLAPPTEDNLRRRAALSRSLGKLDAALAAVPEGKNDPWRLALLRAKGAVPEAIALAGKMGRHDVAACLALFQGDPVPFFEWYADQGNTMPLFRLNADLAKSRWVGDERGAMKASKIMRESAQEGDEGEKVAMLSLILNGYLKDALAIWEKNPDYREFATSYYGTVELPEKIIEIYGYVGTAEEKLAWRKERLVKLAGLGQNWDRDDEVLNSLLEVAGFLVGRGELEEGYEIAHALGDIIRKEAGEEEWFEFLNLLGRRRGIFYEMAFVLAAKSLDADAKDELVEEILGTLFFEGDAGGRSGLDIAKRNWERLKKVEGMDAPERLVFLGQTYGAGYPDSDVLEKFLDGVRADAKGMNDADRREVYADLLNSAAARDDAREVLELLVLLAEIDGFDQWSNSIGLYAAYLGDWDRAMKAWTELLTSNPSSGRSLVKLGTAQMHKGMLKEARKNFEKAALYSLDEAEVLQSLAVAAYAMGAREESKEYYRRILLTGSPSDAAWIEIASDYANAEKLEKRWKVASAFVEIGMLYDIRDRSSFPVPTYYLRKRFDADFLRGLALHEEGDTAGAKVLIEGCFNLLIGDGLLADDFFPLLREAGLVEEHDRYFEIAFQRIKESIKAYPKTHNTYNSGAWLASRAVRRLDEAHAMSEEALRMRPKQAAYLDTMGEVWFAMQDRENAVQWSKRACDGAVNAGHAGTGGAELREQLRRFEEDEFPVR